MGECPRVLSAAVQTGLPGLHQRKEAEEPWSRGSWEPAPALPWAWGVAWSSSGSQFPICNMKKLDHLTASYCTLGSAEKVLFA